MKKITVFLVIIFLLFSCSKKKKNKEKEITNVKRVIIKPKDTVKIVLKDTMKPIKKAIKKSDKLKVIINGKIYYKKNIGDTPHHSRHDEEGSETFIYRSVKTNNCYDIRTQKATVLIL